MCIFFCKQKTAYEMRISDWSSDVCSSDLHIKQLPDLIGLRLLAARLEVDIARHVGVLEDVMAAAGPLEFESKGFGDAAQIFEAGVAAGADPRVEFGDAGHGRCSD